MIFQVFHMFYVSVSDAYFKRFICFWTYIASKDGNGAGRGQVASVDLPPKPDKKTWPGPKPRFGWKFAPAPEPNGDPKPEKASSIISSNRLQEHN
jgi:hypothetical protein